jgi:hypothetical protein
MPGWEAPAPLELQLWYGDLLVADLHQVFPHQGTWFANYDLRIVRGEVPNRLSPDGRQGDRFFDPQHPGLLRVSPLRRQTGKRNHFLSAGAFRESTA